MSKETISDSDEEMATTAAPAADVHAGSGSDDGEAPNPVEEGAQPEPTSDSDKGVKEQQQKRKRKDKLSGSAAKKGRNEVHGADKGFFWRL